MPSNLLWTCVLVLVSFVGAQAAQDVVSKEPRPVRQPIAAAKGTEQGKEGVEPEKVRYYYDPTGKTDPFKSFIAEPEEVEEKKKRKPRTYLETLDLSQLELIAIIVGPKGNWAMVRDSKGMGHVIQKGTFIGTRGGVVHQITAKELVVREQYKDFKGNLQEKLIAKTLPSLE